MYAEKIPRQQAWSSFNYELQMRARHAVPLPISTAFLYHVRGNWLAFGKLELPFYAAEPFTHSGISLKKNSRCGNFDRERFWTEIICLRATHIFLTIDLAQRVDLHQLPTLILKIPMFPPVAGIAIREPFSDLMD